MRGRVHMKLGAREIPLLPSFEVTDKFESKHGGVLHFIERLANGHASLDERAYMIWLGAKAGDPETDWKFDRVKEAIWENGHWSSEQVHKEIEFIEALAYTPEQMLRKKAERAAAAEAQAKIDAMMQGLSGDSLMGASEPQPSI